MARDEPLDGEPHGRGSRQAIVAVATFALLLAVFWMEFRDSPFAQPLRDRLFSV